MNATPTTIYTVHCSIAGADYDYLYGGENRFHLLRSDAETVAEKLSQEASNCEWGDNDTPTYWVEEEAYSDYRYNSGLVDEQLGL